jgi:hypothetical protein
MEASSGKSFWIDSFRRRVFAGPEKYPHGPQLLPTTNFDVIS